MATASRQVDVDLDRIPLHEAMEQEPFRFQFFQAIRLLQRCYPHRNMIGEFVHPSSEVVRFAAHQSLAFPASEIQALDFPENQPPRMTLNFMGLTGPEGVLPLCYTEFMLERKHRRDGSVADFFDIFNHRAISLFYQAWEKNHFAFRYERGEKDQLSAHLMDLVGLGTAGLQKRLQPEVADESLLYYCGLIAQRPHSASALEQILADYFDVPVAVTQFAGAWYRLPRGDQTCLQETNSPVEKLGFGTVVGDEIYDRQALVRICLGPLTLSQYCDFLPTGSAHQPLRSLVRFFSGDELDFELQLILNRNETPGLQLDRRQNDGPQLGWTSWIKSVPLGRDPGDTVIRL